MLKKRKRKKKRRDKEKKDKEKLNLKTQTLNNASKIDTSKGGLISQNSSVGFNNLNTSSTALKRGGNTINSTNASLNTTNNSQKNLTNNNAKQNEKKEEVDEFGVTTDMILAKTQNKGIFQIKIMTYIFVILFCVILIYFFVKLFISIGFIDDIKNIFDDFGTVSFKYSMVYYYFNTLRILLVAPTFTNEKIFDSMEADLIKETDNINKVLNNRMKNYASTNILFNAFTRSQEDTSITNISAIICEKSNLCDRVLSSVEYNMIKDGIDVAINAIVQETQNIYNDFDKIQTELNGTYINSTRENVTKWFINDKFKQVDVNLNFVLSLVQQRIYTAFLEDSDSLTHKFQNQINIFNSCAIIYCCLLGIFVIIFVVYRIQNMTKVVEDSTMRLNRAFFFIKENNLGNQMNSQTNSFV